MTGTQDPVGEVPPQGKAALRASLRGPPRRGFCPVWSLPCWPPKFRPPRETFS